MPPTHIVWSQTPIDSPMAGLERRRLIGEKAMISHITLRRGCSVATHSHENEQFSCVLSGRLRFGIDGGQVLVSSGEALLIPGGVPHSAEALEDTVVLDVFSPPSQKTGIDRR